MAATIRDIAKATGLSIGTVSRALKNQSGLTEKTRVRVSNAARELGYDLSKLKQGKIRRIAFLLHRQHNTISSSPFFSPVLHGAEEACRREGIALSLVAIGPSEPVMEQIRVHQPDAILCAGYFEPELLNALRHTSKPIALVDYRLRGFTSINPDNRLGGYLATRHLIQCGRKRIAMISGSLAHFSIQERARGYRQALYDARMLADPSLEISIADPAKIEEGVREVMRQLFAMSKPPDALFCYNDSAALAAMHWALEQGMKIPHDLAIVGFDDISAAAKAIPPLTTIHVNKEALGAAGIEMLIHQNGDEVIDKTVDVRLIVRESSTDD